MSYKLPEEFVQKHDIKGLEMAVLVNPTVVGIPA